MPAPRFRHLPDQRIKNRSPDPSLTSIGWDKPLHANLATLLPNPHLRKCLFWVHAIAQPCAHATGEALQALKVLCDIDTIWDLECCKCARMRFHCANGLMLLRNCTVAHLSGNNADDCSAVRWKTCEKELSHRRYAEGSQMTSITKKNTTFQPMKQNLLKPWLLIAIQDLCFPQRMRLFRSRLPEETIRNPLL